MQTKSRIGVIFALLAAFCYAFVSPLSKLLNNNVSPFIGASFLYLGTFLVALIVFVARLFTRFKNKEDKLTKKEIPYLLLAALFHVGASIFLLLGLQTISSANASLLTSLEIISTSIFAYFFFKEKISKYLWVGIAFIFASIVLISLGDLSNFKFNIGVIYCLLSPICFGFANNFQKKISHKDPIISIGSMGIIGFIITSTISAIIREPINLFPHGLAQIGIGVVSYGIALILFIYAERYIGAAKTSAYFCIYPFISIALSFIIFQEAPYFTFYIGLGLLLIGYIFLAVDAMKNVKNT